MQNPKIKFMLFLAILCIILFGRLFWIVTKVENQTSVETPPANEFEIADTTTENSTTSDILPSAEQTLTGKITADISIPTNESSQASTELTILLPKRFYNTGFQQLAQKMKTDYNITVHYKGIDNLAYYKQLLSKKTGDKVDLYLAPSDWLADYEGKQLTFTEDISPYVNSLFTSIIKNTNTTFIPFAIDPLVTIIPTRNEVTSSLTIKDLAGWITTRGKKAITMPILRGLDTNDKKILDQSRESFPNAFIVSYQLISQIYQAQDARRRNILITTMNNPEISKRSYGTFKVNYSKFLKKNQACANFPDICLISYGIGESKFGFLSDLLVQKTFFKNDATNTGTIVALNTYNFPYLTGEYKVRGRGFVPDPDTTNDANIQLFVQELTTAGNNNSLPLRSDVFSAFNTIFDIQKIDRRYETILKYEPNFSLMRYPITLQDNFLKFTNFIPLLQENSAQGQKNGPRSTAGQASATEFFQESTRTR